MSEVMRVEKSRNYTVMSNYHLTDLRLSLKAIGLLSKILSLPDGWDYTVIGLTKICTEGKAAVATAIKELEAAGYIERRQLRRPDGSFGGTEYVVHEAPITENRSSADGQSISPITDFPSADNPTADNRAQLNTNISSTKLLNTNIPPIAPQKPKGKGRREHKEQPEWKPERFKSFWEAYPRGESKQAAINAWDKLKPDDIMLGEMARGLLKQLKSEQWLGGIGIPYASTWLNQRRWTDEAKAPIRSKEITDGGGLPEW